MIKVELKGYKELSRKLGKLADEFEDEVDGEIEEVAKLYVSDAVHLAQSQGIFDEGRLLGAIRHERLAPMAYNIVAAVHYAAYHEWGTITHVRVPADQQAYAIQFKGRGRKKTGGIYPRPFFFPPMPKAQERMKDIPQTVYKRLLS
jgi:hypothetical protein